MFLNLSVLWISAALLRRVDVEATASKAVSGVALLATDCSKSSTPAFLADAFEAVFGVLFAVLAVLGFFSIFYTENYTF